MTHECQGPDVVFFDQVRKYDEFNPKFTEGVPPLAVEVLSPTDRIGKVTRRITPFLQSGMRLVWLVDELPKGPTGKILKREIQAPADPS